MANEPCRVCGASPSTSSVFRLYLRSNGINDITDKILVAGLTATIAAFVRNAPAQILYAVLTPIWVISGVGEADRAIRKQKLFDAISQNTLPIDLAAAIGVLLLGGLFFL